VTLSARSRPARDLRRAVVLMAHPGHAGIMRGLGTLHAGARDFGWELCFVFPGADPQVTAAGLGGQACYVTGLHRWRQLAGRLRLPLIVGALARAVRRQRAALVYSATLSTFPYGWLAARLCGVAAAVHIYSSYGSAAPYRKYWLGRARHVIAPSRDSLGRAAAAIGGFAGAAAVIYNGVDVARVQRAAAAPAPETVRLPAGGLLVGMVANMDRRKNPAALVEATARLAPRFPDLRLLLVGPFPEPAYHDEVCARARALGVAERLLVAGAQTNPFPLMRACDLIVHPARRDPFPIALLEAMALERPVVAAAVGGIPEMIVDGDTGVLVAPDDVGALAAAMGALLADPARRAAMGRAGRERLETRFGLEQYVAGMFGAFDAAVADPGQCG
jgi:glycosyltransferase involved in cell wall biosynthesis